ncbi:hypothetical protein GUJ93_ZPchr0006g43134 [Zizania palustris]|uniref:Uncharacterized protein n=1 Tax=Zizania palustris TaxID=103762 RepID=A0A8J5W2S1_ZIZPA|nr:hypothetical protein GUJ93_ZPchr0006g43134 [Zizania palustris]
MQNQWMPFRLFCEMESLLIFGSRLVRGGWAASRRRVGGQRAAATRRVAVQRPVGVEDSALSASAGQRLALAKWAVGDERLVAAGGLGFLRWRLLCVWVEWVLHFCLWSSDSGRGHVGHSPCVRP